MDNPKQETQIAADVVVYDSGDTACGEDMVALLDQLVADLAVGQTLLLINSDPIAPLDIRAWARRNGQDYLGEQTYEGRPAYLLRRER